MLGLMPQTSFPASDWVLIEFKKTLVFYINAPIEFEKTLVFYINVATDST